MIRSLAPTKGVALACGLVLAATGLAVPLSSPTSAAPAKVLIDRDPTSQRVEFVRATAKGADLHPGLAGRSSSASVDKSEDWLDEQATLFGVTPDELVLARNESVPAGRTLTYTQEHHGVPVFGAALKVNFDAAGALTSVNGHVVPGLKLATTPGATAATAEGAAISAVRADPPTDEAGRPASLTDAQAEATLVIYETGSTLGQGGIPYLAWQIEVTAGPSVREQVILDAHKLTALNRWSDAHRALNRTLRTVTSDSGTIDNSSDDVLADVWREGQPTAGLAAKRHDLMETTRETYWMFRNMAGRDSFDGQGAEMVVVDNRLDNCPNASWMGVTTFCPGIDADDIVAHEWGHAYSGNVSGLIYQWQPGALYESYADVWGETIDLLNQREDDGETITAPRPDSSCTRNTSGRTLATVTIDEPASIAGPCVRTAKATTGPFLLPAPQTVRVVVGTDAADATGPSTTDGCTTLTNPAAVAGSWVYLDREPGACTIATKADQVVAAGGKGLLVGAGDGNEPTATAGNRSLTHLMIPQVSGDAITSIAGATPVMVTLAGDAPHGTNSHRWLIGEEADAMPTALRDMWNPNCVGDPAKVTDAQYYCDEDDNGGVHWNSGVPNRAYSLAVDGGSFNGRTVDGMGLDKAAQIWWRAVDAYLTPTSDFNDFASSLAQSCSTLVGQPIDQLSLTDTPGAGAAAVTTDDCGELDKVIAATELRTDVVDRCETPPRFTTVEPSGCGAGTTKIIALEQDFEAGLGGWTPSKQPAGGTASPGPASWTTTSTLRNTSGSAAYVPSPYGSCASGSVAGISSLTSPLVTVASALAPRLTFRHAVALEDGYDGANVKISVNGGGFSVVPPDAYTHNGPDSLLFNEPSDPAADNPMAAELTWSGAENRTLSARWATSQVDLTAAGVDAGDSIRLRFDLGTDVCYGWDGWYVDDIAVTYCAPIPTVTTPTPPAVPTAAPSRTTVKVSPAKLRRGKAFTVQATVKSSTAVAGRVTFRLNGASIGTATVKGGRATVKVSAKQARKLKVSSRKSNTVSVAYAGSAKVARSSTTLKVRARK